MLSDKKEPIQKPTDNKPILPDIKDGEIPKIGHFIWAGGKKPLVSEGIENIRQFLSDNPTFEAYLWVDPTTSSAKNIAELKEYYGKQIGPELFPRLRVVDIEEAIQQIPENIREAHRKIIRYEIDNFRPNYGASSDLLRYLILYLYGGFYADVADVNMAHQEHLKKMLTHMEAEVAANRKHPKKLKYYQDAVERESKRNCLKLKTLEEFYNNTLNKPENLKLYVDGLSQISNLALLNDDRFKNTKDLQIFIKNALEEHIIGNDAFICPKKNPLMKKIYDEAIQNYTITEKSECAVMTYGGNAVRERTIYMTGPEHVQAVLTQEMKSSEKELKIGLLRQYDSHCVVSPALSNTLNWLKAQPITGLTKQKAYEHALRLMQFELEQFHIFRLEDFMGYIIEAVDSTDPMKSEKKEAPNKNDKAEAVLKDLQQLPTFKEMLATIKNSKTECIVQCAFRYDCVRKFYQENNLMIKPRPTLSVFSKNISDKTGLHDPDILENIIYRATFIKTIDAVNKDFLQIVENKQKTWDSKQGDFIDQIFSPHIWGPERLFNLLPLMQDGLDFMENYLKNAKLLRADKFKLKEEGLPEILPKKSVYFKLSKIIVIYYQVLDKLKYCIDHSPNFKKHFKDKFQDPDKFFNDMEERIHNIMKLDNMKDIPAIKEILKKNSPGDRCVVM